ncbi:MAG: L,D-transpeptidase [Beijerinckiaceae bacterium]|jgi:hypothetical protein|nr:L,D-transpeptidase [Beijerinckiaceae bacterium]
MLRRCLAVLAAFFALFATVTAASARVDIKVDLASQRMQVQTADGESYSWAISSGREGYRTIRGSFQPYRLEKKWYSRKYGGNMPNAIFFRGGFAIHGTGAVGMLGRPASHGCVRLHPANAAKLFALVQKHGKGATRIAINGIAPDQNSRFAKAKPAKTQAQVAKAKRQSPDWATARGRVLQPAHGYVDPGAALGFRPVGRSQGDWFFRR